MGGVVGIVVVLLVAFLAPWIAPYDPYETVATPRLPPSPQHLFGTDAIGRDVFSRVIFGTRIVLGLSIATVFISCGIGLVLGTLGGYFGGVVDLILMRITDGFLAIPNLLLAMIAVAVFGPSPLNIVWAISLSAWTWNARIVRSAVKSIRHANFILIEEALGAKPMYVIAKHIIPNCMGPLLVQASLQLGLVILISSGLSFLGLGVQPPLPEWGLMIAEGRRFFPTCWWLTTFPGLAISAVVIAFTLVGDGIRDIIEREIV